MRSSRFRDDYEPLPGEVGIVSLRYRRGDPRRYGAIGDASDDTRAFQNAARSAEATDGRMIVPQPPAAWHLSDHIVTTQRLEVVGEGRRPLIVQTSSQKELFCATAPIRLRNLSLQGPSYAAEQVLGSGVRVEGRSAEAYIDIGGVLIDDVELFDWSYGVLSSFIKHAKLINSDIHDCFYAGQLHKSITDFEISGGAIVNITGAPNAYGISCSRTSGASLAKYPRSARGKIHDLRVDDVVHWEAVDTHGGEDIEIYNIKGRGNAIGAEVTYDATDDIAPRNVTVRRCEFDAGGNTKHQTAIEINGSATSPAVDCSIEDCESRGYGLAGASEYGAFRVQNAIRPVVRRIKAFDSVEAGLVLLGKVTEFKGEDVHVERLTGRSGMVAAVKVPYGKVDGTLDGVSGDAGLFAGVRAASPQALDVQNCTILTKGTRFSPDPKYFRRARDRSERE